MLFKLSIKNIRQSIKDYTIYFFTLMLGVAIFYIFNAMESSTALMEINASQGEIIEMMKTALSATSIFVCFVLGFLIVYASQFLIKRRKKEFGVYMTLGMSKYSISKILLVETFIIGLLSLIVGLVIGVFGSQFMSILVANMFEVNMSSFQIVFSMYSFSRTVLFFTIIYLIVMIFNVFSISKCKLVNLIQASKHNEKIKIKKTWLSIVLFIIACALLGTAYYLVVSPIALLEFNSISKAILLGCAGTLLFFYSLSGLLLTLMKKSKRYYYHNLNIFVIRQVNSKINTTVVSMSVICIMLFMTICILSSGLAIKNSFTSNLRSLTPVDFNLQRDLSTSIIDEMKAYGFDTDQYLKDSIAYNRYTDEKLTYGTVLGYDVTDNVEEDIYTTLDILEVFVALSDYNQVAKLYGLNQYTLNEDEYLVVANFEPLIKQRNQALKKGVVININENVLHPKYDACVDGFLTMEGTKTNAGITIVSDRVAQGMQVHRSVLVANYNTDEEDQKDIIETKMETIYIEALRDDGIYPYLASKSNIYIASVGLGSMTTFIGLYLGLIFLLASAAILALKELSETSDNKKRYEILKNIGASEHMINKALFKQIGIFFLLPISLAIIHSIFGILFANNVLVSFGNEGKNLAILITGLFMVAIYGGYFLITYFCSKNIIK